MTDQHWDALALQIANARKIEAGTNVSITVTDASALPAARALVAEVFRRGGNAQVLAVDEEFDRLAIAFASEDVLATPGPMEIAAMKWSDVHVAFRAMVPPVDGSFDEARLAVQRSAKGVVSTARWQQTRWTIVRVPTPEWSALIGVSFETLLGEFLAACVDDWNARGDQWTKLCAQLNLTSSVRISDADTDLTLSTVGRTWVPFAGEANLPDGEIATAPVDDGVDGYISFPGRFYFGGATIEDLRLEFVDGNLTAFDAAAGKTLVERIIEAPGAKRVGELGIGTHPAVQTFTGDLFIDEKILGTAHIALGRAYPECGGVNESSVHWDIVKDLRTPTGRLTAGDFVLIDNGIPTSFLTGVIS